MSEAPDKAKVAAILPIPEFIDWMKSPESGNPYSEHTIRAYMRELSRFSIHLAAMGASSVKEVNKIVIRGYIKQISDNGKKASSKLAKNAISALLDWCWGNGLVERNEARNLDSEHPHLRRGGRREDKLPEVLFSHEIERIADFATKAETIADFRNMAIVGFILDTGLRESEIVALKAHQVENIKGQDGFLRIIGKGRKERIVRPLTGFRPLLNDYLDMSPPENGDAPLFRSLRGGGAISTSALYRIVNGIFHAAGIEHKTQFGPHLLRHTAASLMLRKGMSLREVQENMGHKSIKTTEIYLHLI